MAQQSTQRVNQLRRYDLDLLSAAHGANERLVAKQISHDSGTTASVARWPGNRDFALFLSHDIDQFHDRELFRVIADVNHIRRMLVSGERGSLVEASKRVARALIKPKDPLLDFQTILRLEGQYGFRSTFFILHDRYWVRYGPRFRIDDPVLARIAKLVREAGCEIGVHGGYYRFNDAAGYRDSLETIRRLFDQRAVGIRNHLLRFYIPETWMAQAEAGFAYDATFGYPDRLGPTEGFSLPFWASGREAGSRLDLLELPLTVMDTTVFRYLGLSGDAAVGAALGAVNRVAEQGGLVTLLWHNNFFNEPEYRDWQYAYEQLLAELAGRSPYCATGAEISRWWRGRAGIELRTVPSATDGQAWTLELSAPNELNDVVVLLEPTLSVRSLDTSPGGCIVEHGADQWTLRFPRLDANPWTIKVVFG